MDSAKAPINPTSWIAWTLVLVVGVSMALFIHDSGQRILAIARIMLEELLLPFFLAILVAYLLDPFVNSLERSGVRRLMGVIFVYSILIGLVALLSKLLFPLLFYQVLELRLAFPFYLKRIIHAVVTLQNWLHSVFGIFGGVDLTQSASDYLATHQSDFLSHTLATLSTFISLVVLVPLFSFFFLYDGHRVKRAIIKRVPNRYFESALVIFHHVNVSLGNFVRGRFYECFIVGLISLIGFALVGLKYAWVFGVVAAIVTLVPVFGTLAGMAITCSFVLIDGGTYSLFLWVLGIYLFAHFIDTLLLVPIFVVRTGSLHFMTGVLAILVGGHVAGVLGMIIAVPVVSICKIILAEILRHLGPRGFYTPAEEAID